VSARREVPRLKTVTRYAFAVLILANSALADDIVMAPQKFSHCVTCHGVELAGNQSVDAPNLSVLESWYVDKQLIAYTRLWRGHAEDEHGIEMRPMAAALNDADRAEVVSFVASVPKRAADASLSGDLVAEAVTWLPGRWCTGPAPSVMVSAARVTGTSARRHWPGKATGTSYDNWKNQVHK